MGKSIAIFHPEGNFPNNPHLSGLMELLLEGGHALHVYCASHFSQQLGLHHPRLHVHPVPPPAGPWDALRGVLFAPGGHSRSMPWVALEGLPRFSLVLGVDLGIVDAAWVARAQGIPHGLLSYELFFTDEVGTEFKQDEVDACRDAVFALCQDVERAGHLSRENSIPPEHILTMPVAGRGASAGLRTTALHEALGLDRSIKIAVSIGSADAAWAGSGQLLENLRHWPEDWVLVLHHRYDPQALEHLLGGLEGPARSRLHVSPFPSLPSSELHRLLHACDLGLCFYTPTYDHPVLGRNLEHIGMASGKFTTYLQHGLPVLVNDQGEMGGHVLRQGLGWQVADIGQTHLVLTSLDRPALDSCRGRCLEFFSGFCDLDVTARPLLAAIESACGGRDGQAAAGSGAAADTAALCVVARLHMARGDAAGAVAPLLAAQRLARDEGDFQAVYGLALSLYKRGHLPEAREVCQGIAADARVAAPLAAWVLFKSGEAWLEQGDEPAARAFFARALERNPAHAKAAIYLAPPDKPLCVRLGPAGQEAGAAGGEEAIAVPMDPWDAGLWEYYFSRRHPDYVDLRLGGAATPEQGALLAEMLGRHLSPGGAAVLRLPEAGGAQASSTLGPALEAQGLGVRFEAGKGPAGPLLHVAGRVRAGR